MTTKFKPLVWEDVLVNKITWYCSYCSTPFGDFVIGFHGYDEEYIELDWGEETIESFSLSEESDEMVAVAELKAFAEQYFHNKLKECIDESQ